MKNYIIVVFFVMVVIGVSPMLRNTENGVKNESDAIALSESDDITPLKGESQGAGNNAVVPEAGDNGNADRGAEASEKSPQQNAALEMGFDIGNAKSIESYFYELEEKVRASGTGAVELARLYRVCRGYSDIIAIGDEGHPDYQFAKECYLIPDRGAQYSAKVIAWGADHGDRDSILAEINHPPEGVLRHPESNISRDWVKSTLQRLATLADNGDRQAKYQLGFNLANNIYGVKDIPVAAKYLHEYYETGSALNTSIDPNMASTMRVLKRMCGAVEREEWNDACI
jgi:hypothetical protein